MSSHSSERTVTAATTGSPTTIQNNLASAHHYVSIKLTSRNFLFWRTQLIPFLRGQDLLGFVDGSTPCPPATVDVAPASGESGSGGATVVSGPNPAYHAWIKQDQSILSLLISSLSDEVMYLAVGRNTSQEVWQSIGAALGSSTRARCLNLLGQFQSIRQGNSSTAEFLGKAQLLVESLALAGRPLSLDEQNMYVFRGLRPEFRALAASLTVTGTPVSIPQLLDYLQAQEFIISDDFPAGGDGGIGGSPTAMIAGHGRHQSGDGGSGQSRGGQNRGRNGRGRGGSGRGRGGTPRCQICRSHGHTAVYCFKRYSTQPPAQANLVVAGDDVAAAPAMSWYPDTGVKGMPRRRHPC
ncbi:PREDICTED: uncharacterized protein LOC109150394 [Ipomoea nil]|uniref:uncharacterized protein LOC109150394 n=1 Tax=Ipomoea nil TaxID=35883 RepID=UPI0009015061|nr:PREDICTED: uncharacterized protein LOC109150394 [Ipomoea nil]